MLKRLPIQSDVMHGKSIAFVKRTEIRTQKRAIDPIDSLFRFLLLWSEERSRVQGAEKSIYKVVSIIKVRFRCFQKELMGSGMKCLSQMGYFVFWLTLKLNWTNKYTLFSKRPDDTVGYSASLISKREIVGSIPAVHGKEFFIL